MIKKAARRLYCLVLIDETVQHSSRRHNCILSRLYQVSRRLSACHRKKAEQVLYKILQRPCDHIRDTGNTAYPYRHPRKTANRKFIPCQKFWTQPTNTLPMIEDNDCTMDQQWLTRTATKSKSRARTIMNVLTLSRCADLQVRNSRRHTCEITSFGTPSTLTLTIIRGD